MDYLKDDIAAGNETRVQTDIQRMSAAMDLMQKRIDGILDLARSGWLSNMDEVVDFNELIAEALELVHGRISKRGIIVAVEEKLPKVLGNRTRLLEVLQNLLDNAAKFMGDQISPRIEVGQRGAEAENPVFFIKDNGMGISPDQHERIFGIFNKLDPKAEGTGIGLALVKKIIEVHRGRIWIESEAGLGSTFYFTLPRR
jgi:signal transduction histidine kinase